MIFLPKFDIEQAIKWMNKSTTMMGVPTFYTRLLSDSRFNHSLTEHMRLFISGSAPLLATTHKEFEDRTSKKILERYGMTETNMCTSNPLSSTLAISPVIKKPSSRNDSLVLSGICQ